MSRDWLLIAEGVGGLAALALLWNQVQTVLRWIAGIVIISKDVDPETKSVLLSYLLHAGKKIATLGTEQFGHQRMWVRPLETVQRVVFRNLHLMTNVFVYKRRLIWNAGNSTGAGGFAYFRGTLDWSVFVRDALDFETELREARDTTIPRFHINKVIGLAGLELANTSRQTDDKPIARPAEQVRGVDNNFIRANGWELLHWEWDQVGVPQSKRALDDMALSPDMERVVEMVRFWLQSREWHESKGIPWRLSFMWQGPPGTGKTSMARALGETFDLPIFSFYLGTLTDADFTQAWDKMSSMAPCIAFLDDVDRTFNGDKNIVNPESGLSYATFLQALSGIDRTHGILVIATANHPEKLDDALFSPPTAEGGMPSRPGRIDEYVSFGPLNEAGRRKIANRILGDALSDEIESIVAAGHRDTGAQFQLRCIQTARAQWLGQLRSKRASQ